VVFGHNYIRGCIDKIFVNGFLNRTAIETHRFYFDDVCRALPWEQLMTSDFIKKPSNNKHNNYKSGDVILCSCYGNKCNGANSARKLGQLSSCRTLVTASLGFIIIFYLMLRF
uniref:Uncharacterized protein n=1 Tax=Romanomermis culicivorax TaxID=13658 RepID=A0A915ISF8_ROMCU